MLICSTIDWPLGPEGMPDDQPPAKTRRINCRAVATKRNLKLISRTWHGSVPLEHGDAFATYLKETGVKESRSIPGNVAAYVHRVEQEGYSHFFLCTLWSSWEAVQAFAGATPEIAVAYPEDAKYFLIPDPIVIHQEVDTDQDPFAGLYHTADSQRGVKDQTCKNHPWTATAQRGQR